MTAIRREKNYIIKKASIIFRHNRDIRSCEKNALKQAKNQGFSRGCTTSEPLQNRGSRVRILLPLPKTRKSMQRIGFFVFRMRLGRENPTPQSGVRVQRLAFLLCKMRSLTARQTCNGAKRSMESSCPCQNRSHTASVFLFLVFFVPDLFVESGKHKCF